MCPFARVPMCSIDPRPRNCASQAIDTTVNIFVESIQGLEPGLAGQASAPRAKKNVAVALNSSTALKIQGAAAAGTSVLAGLGSDGARGRGGGRLLIDQVGSGVPGLSSRGGLDSVDGASSGSDEDAEAESSEARPTSPRNRSKFVVVATNVDTDLQRCPRGFLCIPVSWMVESNPLTQSF